MTTEKPENNKSSADKFDSNQSSESNEVSESQKKIALEYVASNKYDYGPSIRSRELEWEIDNSETYESGIVRVFINYKLKNASGRETGREYVDIDAGGNVLARRQLKTLKESRPLILIGITIISILVAAISIPIMIMDPFGGDPLYVAGRSLWMRAERPLLINYLNYSGADTKGNLYDWQINPTDSSVNQIALVKLTLINEVSNSITITVDDEAAELQTGDKIRRSPIDIRVRSKPTETTATDEDNFIKDFLPIWGTFVLQKGEQIEGYMVFEVPKGSSFKQFRWSASDTAIVNY